MVGVAVEHTWAAVVVEDSTVVVVDSLVVDNPVVDIPAADSLVVGNLAVGSFVEHIPVAERTLVADILGAVVVNRAREIDLLQLVLRRNHASRLYQKPATELLEVVVLVAEHTRS